MRRTDSLFQLVKAMNRTDKRNFRLMTQMTSGNKKYLRLFDAIDRQSVYDEDRLVAQFSNDPMVKQFSVSKNYLYNNILRSLVHFYQGKNQDRSPIRIQVLILIDKNLHAQAWKLLRKAKSRAAKAEDFHELLQLLGDERQVLMGLPDLRNPAKLIEEIGQEESGVLGMADNLLHLRHLLDKVDSICWGHRHARDAVEQAAMEQILAEEALQSVDSAQSCHARLLFYASWARALIYLQDLEGAVEMCRDFLEEMDSAPWLGESLAELRLALMWDLGGVLLAMGRDRDFESLLKRLGGMALDQTGEIAPVDLRMSRALHRRAVAEGRAAMREFQAMQEAGKQVQLHDQMRFLFRAGQIEFMAGNHAEALTWLNAFLDGPRTEIWEDMQGYARILHLLSNYELENVDLIEHCLKSAVRFLSKRERMYELERAVIRWVRMLMQVEEQEQRKAIFNEMGAELEAMATDPHQAPAVWELQLLPYVARKLKGIDGQEGEELQLKRSFPSQLRLKLGRAGKMRRD